MEKTLVNINLNATQNGFSDYVREKARKAGSCIIYEEDGFIIQEDPGTNKKTILRRIEQMIK